MIARTSSWDGTPELHVAALIWDLPIIVVRPGASTVTIGKGKRVIWLELSKDHSSCLKCEDSANFKFKRKLHTKSAYLLAP